MEHPMYSRSVHKWAEDGRGCEWKDDLGRQQSSTVVCRGPHQGLTDTDWQNYTGDSTGTWIVFLSPCSPKSRQDGEGKKGRKKTGGNAHYYLCRPSCWCTAYCPEVRNTVHMLISHWNCLRAGTDGSLWGDWADAVAATFLRWNGLRGGGEEKRVHTGFFFLFLVLVVLQTHSS